MTRSPVAYEIIEELGQGGMCVVYRAWHLSRGRMVALKMPKPTLLSDLVGLERFVREAQLNSQLSHPNIVDIYEIDESAGVPFIAMEYVDGVTLLDILKAEPSLPMTVHLAKQIADALAYAHEQGVIHRDLKPSNILVDDGLNVRVADWGMAKAVGDSQGLTQTGIIVGTPDYMAPEQLTAEGATAKTDLYAFGLILFEMTSHSRPFQGNNLAERVGSRLSTAAPLLNHVFPDAPPALVSLVSSLLARNPDERPENASHVAPQLAEVERTMRQGVALARQGATVKIARQALEERRDSSGDDSTNFPLPSSVKRRAASHNGNRKFLSLVFVALLLLVSSVAYFHFRAEKAQINKREAKCTIRLLSLTKAILSCRHLEPGELDIVTKSYDSARILSRQSLTFPKDKEQINRELTLPRGTSALRTTISSLKGGQAIELKVERQKLVDKLLEPLADVTEQSFIQIARPLASFRARVGNKAGEDVQSELMKILEPIGLQLNELQAISKNIKDFGHISLGTSVARRLLVLRRLESLLQDKKFQPLPWGKIASQLGAKFHHRSLDKVNIDCDRWLPLTPLRGRIAKGKYKEIGKDQFVYLSTEKRLAVMDKSTKKDSIGLFLKKDGSVDRLEFECTIKDNVSPWPAERLRLGFTCFSLFPDFEVTYHINGNPVIIHNLAGILGKTKPNVLDRKHSVIVDLDSSFLKNGKNSIVLSCRDLPGARAMNRLSMWMPVFFIFGGPPK